MYSLVCIHEILITHVLWFPTLHKITLQQEWVPSPRKENGPSLHHMPPHPLTPHHVIQVDLPNVQAGFCHLESRCVNSTNPISRHS